MKLDLDFTSIFIAAATLIAALIALILRIFTKADFEIIRRFFDEYNFIIDKVKISIDENKARFNLKTIKAADERRVLNFVYHKIPQMRQLLLILVFLNLTSDIIILYSLCFQIYGVRDPRQPFIFLVLYTFVSVLIQLTLLVLLEKGLGKFKDIKKSQNP